MKKNIYLIGNVCIMIAEIVYVLVTKFRLTEVARQKESIGIHTFDIFYVLILALITAGCIVCFKIKSEKVFYIQKIGISLILSIGELFVLAKPVYLEVFWGIPIYVAAVALWHIRKVN